MLIEDGEVLDRRSVDAFVVDGAFEEQRLRRWLRRLLPNQPWAEGEVCMVGGDAQTDVLCVCGGVCDVVFVVFALVYPMGLVLCPHTVVCAYTE